MQVMGVAKGSKLRTLSFGAFLRAHQDLVQVVLHQMVFYRGL